MKIMQDNIEYEVFNPVQRVLKKCVFNPIINYVIPAPMMKRMLENSKSDLAHESLRAAGSWKCMQLSYDNLPPKDFIDKCVLELGSFPAGLRNRKKLSVKMMVELLNRYKGKEHIIVVGIGSGRADNALEAIKASGLKNVKGYFFDLDDDAMEPGRKLAASLGLSKNISYVKADAITIKEHLPENADMLKLIGIIEYLSDEQIATLLKVGFANLNKGGTVLTHAIEPAHGITPFLKRIFKLDLIYRTPEQVQKLLTGAGFEILEVKPEPLNIYTLVTAVKR
ncbi:MAG: methyltransferase [Candidatus Auribacterota bacterium]|jgi:hypothetical protein|uniref:O-methyltransferase C-terminal domain-containing protein n=1 Tax=Candidatus Auribacter fodinae TaxID=2093366 RepID=A0A3A4R3M3_9BACT|nr:MAG: hypothetical protein C4541_06520 [Candidatus Auribacter fodinae]